VEQALEGIAYHPLAVEPDYRQAALLKKYLTHTILLPQDRAVDPFVLAGNLRVELAGKRVAVLIPGTLFDLAGTRHGRGGGWYDRFLSRAPRAWLRIGAAHQSQISDALLEREPWDEPMDGLLLKNGDEWKFLKVSTE
jgi:5-formyltetrahydrofolate cyclo-ligase